MAIDVQQAGGASEISVMLARSQASGRVLGEGGGPGAWRWRAGVALFGGCIAAVALSGVFDSCRVRELLVFDVLAVLSAVTLTRWR